MVEAIVSAAREVMREHGVGALSLNEVARRVHLRPQSLAEYFPSKAALFDELVLRAYLLFFAGDEAAYAEYAPGWKQIEAWFANRVALAEANPDLYQVAFDAPDRNYVPAEQVVAASREMLEGTRRMVAAAVETGTVVTGMPVERAADILLAVRRGVVAERVGKRRYVDPAEKRFAHVVPDAIGILRAAWTPSSASVDGKESP
jgi:AcrR family transcriptional regulator